MRNSVWALNCKLPQHPRLEGDKKTDVLIIGGGICGILCAYFLKQNGVDYILTEGNTIASGITKNTTAKITSLHGIIYDRLIKTLGTEKALMYLTANIITKMYYSDFIKVNNARIPREQISKQLSRITPDVIEFMMKKMLENTGSISNEVSYAISCLYNAIDGIDIDVDVDIARDFGYRGCY